jgi:hypothetical protein
MFPSVIRGDFLTPMKLRQRMETNDSIEQPNTNESNIDSLIDMFVDAIPDSTWLIVKEHLVTQIVDAMPSNIIESITGDPQNDDRALEILDDFYKSSDMNRQLIVDCFNILGPDQTGYALDSLRLTKIQSKN